MHPLHIVYLNGPDIERLALGDAQILAAVDDGLQAQECAAAVIVPAVRLVPESVSLGFFTVLPAVVPRVGLAGVTIAGEFANNGEIGLPSSMGMLTLFDPSTGAPLAILHAASIAERRTGAMTALGARHLARKDSKVLAHVGVGAAAYWNIRLLSHCFELEEIRVHAMNPHGGLALAARLSTDLGKRVTAVADPESCVRDADIVVAAADLPEPQAMFEPQWLRAGASVIRYGSTNGSEAAADIALAGAILDTAGAAGIGQTLRFA